jgi:chromosomal replication initiation ATPase DnaA
MDIYKKIIPERYIDKKFIDIKDESVRTEAIKLSKQFANKEIPGISLTGSVGSGKTHIAFCMLKEYLFTNHKENPESSVFVAKLRTLKKLWLKDLSDGRDSEFYLLDDVGTVKQNEWLTEMLYDLIDYRYENNLPIIITSNLTADEITEKFDIRITSRLIEMCCQLNVNGKDYRLKADKMKIGNIQDRLPEKEIDIEKMTEKDLFLLVKERNPKAHIGLCEQFIKAAGIQFKDNQHKLNTFLNFAEREECQVKRC